jgi:hypothetical protein
MISSIPHELIAQWAGVVISTCIFAIVAFSVRDIYRRIRALEDTGAAQSVKLASIESKLDLLIAFLNTRLGANRKEEK